jgi:large subunit ribosomal protein L17
LFRFLGFVYRIFFVIMRKQVFGRQFKRDKNERKALFNGLISAMILRESITTAEEKAKAIKGDLDKLVTKAKKQKKVQLSKNLKPFEVDKLINVIAPRYKKRAGGYTRIIRTGNRFNDNASMVILQWVEGDTVENSEAITKDSKVKKVETKEVKKTPAKKSLIPSKLKIGKKTKESK